MKALLYFSLGVLATALLDYLLTVYAEQEPVQCDAGSEEWINRIEREIVK